MEISDLDYTTIFKESDDRSRQLYFNNGIFGFRDGVILIRSVEEGGLYGRYYYLKKDGDLCLRRNQYIQEDELSELESIDFGCGVYFEQSYGVGYITRRAARVACKGVHMSNLCGLGIFEDEEQIYTFLINLVTGVVQPSCWLFSSSGTYLYGSRLSEEELSFEELERLINETNNH